MQSVKNLVYLGKVLHHCGMAGILQPKEKGEDDGYVGGEEQRVRDLKWLVERMMRLAKFEAAHHPKESIKV